MNKTITCYKYRPLYQYGEKDSKIPHPFTQSIFEKGELYYSTPKDFNDPFDCNLKLHVDNSTDEEWGTYLDDVMPNPTSPEVLVMKTEKPWRLDPKMFCNIGKSAQNVNYEQSSVLCLSKKGCSIPMFSYYADSHRGIAFEFKFLQTEIPCGIPFGNINDRENWYQRKVVFQDVTYHSKYPELNFHRLRNDDKTIILNTVFAKHKEWEHEAEFRIFRRGVSASSVKFDRKILTRVIFGCKTMDNDVALVRKWLADWSFDVVLAKAKIAKDRFELKVEDFEIVKGTIKK